MTHTSVSQLTRSEKVKLAHKSHGLISRVAQRCKVSHSLVSRVLHGKNTSARVEQALDKELDRELQKAAVLRMHFKPSKKQNGEATPAAPAKFRTTAVQDQPTKKADSNTEAQVA